MLEYDFNKLDNDFITLWSKYILWNDASSIIKPLERLAEKGQINAIQSWYLIKKQEEKNEKIDAIVDGYYGKSFNEALAIANRVYDRDRAELIELRKQISENYDLGVELAQTKYDEGYIIPKEENRYFIEMNRLIEEYKNTEYAKLLMYAADLTESACRSAKTVMVFERLFEIYTANPVVLDCDSLHEKTIKEVGKVARKYLKEYSDHSDEDLIRAKYTLGKNLLFFSKNKKERAEGTKILLELSKRPLSIDKEIEREKIDGTDVMQDLTKSPLIFEREEEKEV